MPIIIFVEGAIGCGKSTMLAALQKLDPSLIVHDEPTGDWRECNGRNLLDLFYADPHTYAFEFQQEILGGFKSSLTGLPDGVHVFARSPRSAYHVFTQALLSAGYINDEQRDVLQAIYDSICPPEFWRTATTIHLRTHPAIAWQRAQQRSRKEERDRLSLGYMMALHDLQEAEFLHNGPKGTTTTVIHEMTGPVPLVEKLKVAHRHIDSWIAERTLRLEPKEIHRKLGPAPAS